MHIRPQAASLAVLVLALCACSAPTGPSGSPVATPPSVTVTTAMPPASSDAATEQMRNTGIAVFSQSWLSGNYPYVWPDHYGELSRRTGLCARAWAKNPKTPITSDAVTKAKTSIHGSPWSVCIENGSMQLAIVAEAIQTARDEGIPDQHLATEAEKVTGDGKKTGLAPSVTTFTKGCGPSSETLIPPDPARCQAAARALVPVLDLYDTLESDWATAVA